MNLKLLLLSFTLFISNFCYAVCPSYKSDDQFNTINQSHLIDPSHKILHKLQNALRKNDKYAFAKLVEYPLRWNVVPLYYIEIHTPDQLFHHYTAIINPVNRQKILDIKDNSDQDFNCIKGNVMLNDGTIWFNHETMKIFAINNMDDNIKGVTRIDYFHRNQEQ